jgi:hypothetical protein
MEPLHPHRTPSRLPWGWRLRLLFSLVLAGAAFGGWLVWGGLRVPRFLETWPPSGPGFEAWTTLEPGVDYCRLHRSQPREIRGHVLRFELGRGDLEFVVPESQPAGSGRVRADWPLTFLRRDRLVAVVNATPFDPEPILPGGRIQLEGLAVSEGKWWSKPVSNLDALMVDTKGGVRMLRVLQEIPEFQWGAGGFLIVRRGGTNTHEKIDVDAVTVVGTTADQRFLYWLVVDGKQPGYSEGLSADEASDLIGELGVTDAIRMDGGASTTIAVAGGWIGGRVLNRPRNWLYPGLPHPVGNVLGIRRRAIPK